MSKPLLNFLFDVHEEKAMEVPFFARCSFFDLPLMLFLLFKKAIAIRKDIIHNSTLLLKLSTIRRFLKNCKSNLPISNNGEREYFCFTAIILSHARGAGSP